MESNVTKYSAAAVVAFAIALVLLGPFRTSNRGGIVWADVVDKVHQMRTVVHKEKYVFWEMGQEEPSLETDVMKYVSEEYGSVEHLLDDQGALTHEVYFLRETQQFIVVAHAEKIYIKLSMPEDIFNRAEATLSARGLVEYFTSGQYTELGRANFDNFDVEGFETADRDVLFPIPEPLRSMFPVKNIVGRIWIDVETSLPAGVEAEFDTGRGLLTGLKKLRGEFKAYDFQWNAEIPDGTFDPNIPEDYQELSLPGNTAIGVAASSVVLAGIAPWCIFFVRRSRRRARAQRAS